MATFSADVYQNEFLPDGGTDVHAIVTVSCSGAGAAGQSGVGGRRRDHHRRHLRLDGRRRSIAAAQQAAAAALDQILDGMWFAVIAGNHQARLAFPAGSELAMVRMDARDPRRGQGRGGQLPGRRRHRDGHLADAGRPRLRLGAGRSPSGTRSCSPTAINQHETPEQLSAAIEGARGQFQCDCRGVGADWQVAEVRRIATALLGSVDLIARAGRRWPPTSSGSCGSR